MKILDKKLLSWEQQGLISGDQADAIRAFERGEPDSGGHWWLYSLLILGAAIIGLGIISLIAANWARIPDDLKLGADFALLASLAVAILWLQKRRHYAFDALIMGFIILCLATIGLIAQIYHINGNWYHALLLWASITFPLVTFSRHLSVHFFWTSLFLHAAIWSLVGLTAGNLRHAYQEIPAMFLLAPLLSATLYSLTQRLHLLEKFRSSFFFWFQISGLLALIVVDTLRSGGDVQTFQASWYIPAWCMAGVLTVIILLRPDYTWLNRGLLIGAIVLLLLYYHPDILFSGTTRYTFSALESSERASVWLADDIRAPILTIAILFLYALHAGNSGHHRTFNLMTFLIGLRFVILYFQAMGGLAATGVGLILSGLMIIGIAWFWYQSRQKLQQWSKELSL